MAVISLTHDVEKKKKKEDNFFTYFKITESVKISPL